ncbi:MAG: TRAP transporter substrate-binding protein DctP [Spirochaetota bacterium]
MRFGRRLILVSLFLAATVPSLIAQQIKLASVAPESSPWGGALNQLAVDWRRISDGRLRLQIYHNAIAGDETDILRKMRIGQLQAAVLTSSGLKQVVPEVFSISVPFMIGSEEQLDYVLEHIRPELDAEFERDRLHVLAWSRAGWVHFFSKEPVAYPEDLKTQRLATDPNDQELQQTFRVLDYRPIPVPQPELLTSLNSGLVDAFYTSPLVAAGYQWFGLAPHMLDLKVAPFLGAIVITDSAWRRIPDEYKEELMDAAQDVADRINDEVRELEAEALSTMRRYGLQVQEATPEIEAAWRRDMDENREEILEIFDPDMTTRIRRLLSEFESR